MKILITLATTLIGATQSCPAVANHHNKETTAPPSLETKHTTPAMNATTYTNPIIDANLADPFIYSDGETYYLIATGDAPDGRKLPIYSSKDLVNWTFQCGAVERGDEDAWNRNNFWAPEVVVYDNRYYLYYTGCRAGLPGNEGNRVGLAISDSPLGPFVDQGRVVSTPSLDGHAWQDDDGQWYLYYVTEFGDPEGKKAGQIYVDKLIDMRRTAGDPKCIVNSHGWQEGPFMLKKDDTYYLTYSIHGWKTDRYQVRYATGQSPLGPFTEAKNSPILSSSDTVKGPGHHMILETPETDWIVYHGWDPEFTARSPRMDRIFQKGDSLHVEGPTHTMQSLENLDGDVQHQTSNIEHSIMN
ncbi:MULTISPECIES: glycoside hydrolase family 43 protein [unclassified Lentimonas]|uniref:glycoside hydrolase family 43 protein n=1 Tax=unclassified Lentimonas TaxID=2630993 RepID=UPI00132A44BC|nr:MULTISPECIES: glycoside hydrolase family 43 protein [unclassified Lentimonas]CAA6689440.1 Unannotated [Lentimonas sp. CC10]CAA6696413.1 Unannotated [Lentimonas sp. CC19]CAA7070505.1 Unannotated [Lentimonas sp. CC11]